MCRGGRPHPMANLPYHPTMPPAHDTAALPITIRHWPGAVVAIVVALACAGTAVSLVPRLGGVFAEGDPVRMMLSVAMIVGVVALSVFGVLMSRARVIIGEDGVTVVGGRRRGFIPWADITGWETESSGRTWLIRAWLGDTPQVVFRVRPLLGVNLTMSDEFPSDPPPDAPALIHRAFDALHDTWLAGR